MQTIVAYSNYELYQATYEQLIDVHDEHMRQRGFSYNFDEEKNIAKFECILTTFETIASFFELTWEYLFSCFNAQHNSQRWDEAWEAFKQRKWIKIVEVIQEKQVIDIKSERIFKVLPVEICSLIVKYFDIFTLAHGSRVSELWNAVLNDETLWKPVLPTTAKNFPIPKGIKNKDYYNTRIVTSQAQLEAKIIDFMSKFDKEHTLILNIFPFRMSDPSQPFQLYSSKINLHHRYERNYFLTTKIFKTITQDLYVLNLKQMEEAISYTNSMHVGNDILTLTVNTYFKLPQDLIENQAKALAKKM